jgi:hypothetical protein
MYLSRLRSPQTWACFQIDREGLQQIHSTATSTPTWNELDPPPIGYVVNANPMRCLGKLRTVGSSTQLALRAITDDATLVTR